MRLFNARLGYTAEHVYDVYLVAVVSMEWLNMLFGCPRITYHPFYDFSCISYDMANKSNRYYYVFFVEKNYNF